MLPSHFAEIKGYQHVYNFITKHLDMQFNDVRGMMKLPCPEFGIDAGCNFAAAAALCNLISGVSVVLYTPKEPNSGSGKKFKELLCEFYPWDSRENKEEKAKVIYDLIRNPLTSGVCALFESLASEYGYSDGRSVRRAAARGRFLGIRYQHGEFYLEGFTPGDITGILAGGLTQIMLPTGTQQVYPQVLSGAVSGIPYIAEFHRGKNPWVSLSISPACSGIWVKINIQRNPNPPEVRREPSCRAGKG